MARVLDRLWTDRLGRRSVDALIFGVGVLLLALGIAGKVLIPTEAAAGL